MVWRIHFSADDLAAVRIAQSADQMIELAYSMQVGCSRDVASELTIWRRHLIGSEPQRWIPLRTLLPPRGYFPDFLTPVSGTSEFEQGADSILRTPRSTLRQDLSVTSPNHHRLPWRGGRLPGWVHRMADGEPRLLAGLVEVMRDYHHRMLEPFWPYIRRQIAGEGLRLLQTLATGGSSAALHTCSPLLRWASPTLLLTRKVTEIDIWLNGRGLLLQPTFFGDRDTTVHDAPGHPLLLTYPIQRETDWFPRATTNPDGDDDPLRKLLGKTRTDLLELLAAYPCNTGEVAGRLGISPASASHQTRVLREAGLVTSERQGQRVEHRMSPFGQEFLDRSRG